MPDASMHATTGAIMGAVTVGLLQDEVEAGGVELVAGVVVAAAAGRAPDILEPVTYPGHWVFFHSFYGLALVGYGTYRASPSKPTYELNRALRWLTVNGRVPYVESSRAKCSDA